MASILLSRLICSASTGLSVLKNLEVSCGHIHSQALQDLCTWEFNQLGVSSDTTCEALKVDSLYGSNCGNLACFFPRVPRSFQLQDPCVYEFYWLGLCLFQEAVNLGHLHGGGCGVWVGRSTHKQNNEVKLVSSLS